MPLPAGTRLGSYEILSPLGAGGMGDVDKARDTKLRRDVALKVLPEAFARDVDRLARFTREAHVLASLNHPHIAQIYGLEEAPATEPGRPDVHALAMELVPGTHSTRPRSSNPEPQPFPGPGPRTQVSTNGGAEPDLAARRQGARSSFRAALLSRAQVDSNRPCRRPIGLALPTQRQLQYVRLATVTRRSRDGKRFLTAIAEGQPARNPVTVVTNWLSAVR